MNSRRKWYQAGKAAGLLLMLGPVFALFAVGYELRSAFATLGSSGLGDPAGLAGAIGEVFNVALGGLISLIFGVLLFVASLRSDRRLRLAEPPPMPPQAA